MHAVLTRKENAKEEKNCERERERDRERERERKRGRERERKRERERERERELERTREGERERHTGELFGVLVRECCSLLLRFEYVLFKRGNAVILIHWADLFIPARQTGFAATTSATQTLATGLTNCPLDQETQCGEQQVCTVCRSLLQREQFTARTMDNGQGKNFFPDAVRTQSVDHLFNHALKSSTSQCSATSVDFLFPIV